jgi:ATP-binding protein involved in chromosome partitioning
MSEGAVPDRGKVLSALNRVRDPKSGKGLAEAGLVRGLTLRADRAGFMLEAPEADVELYRAVRDEAEQVLARAAGVAKAQVVLTTEVSAPAPPRPAVRRARVAEDPQARLRPMPEAERPAHVRRIIAVASGKGGVGKSTVAVSLAAAFARLGLRAGLLDADIYGPSAPHMLGADGEPTFDADKRLNPIEAWGVRVISIGFIVEPGSASIWRGPMASSAVRTLIGSHWGEEARPLDVLVVDLPPGTGDIQLTIAQRLKLDGVVIVSTPQEIALIDARRAIAMFRRLDVAVLGIVENMAFFTDPATGAQIPIFGEGGGVAEAARQEVPMLGQVPLDIRLREACDAGVPLVATDPENPAAQAFLEIARRLANLDAPPQEELSRRD